MVGWFVGNLVFSEKAVTIFLIFCVKLPDYKGKKSQSRIFEKNYWFGDIRKKISKLTQNKTLDVFLRNGSNDVFGFWPEVSTKYDLQFEWNLFFRKICNLEIYDLEIVKKLSKLRFLAILSTLHHQFPLILQAKKGGHDV